MENFGEFFSQSQELALIKELELMKDRLGMEKKDPHTEENNQHAIMDRKIEPNPSKDNTMAKEGSYESHYEVFRTYPGRRSVSVTTLSRLDRQKSWYKLEISRKDSSIKDKYYTHLPTDIRCRSLVEVYNFIEHGDKKAKQQPVRYNKNSNRRVAKKRRGASLIETIEVGYYISAQNLVCRKIMTDPETIAASGEAKKQTEDVAVRSASIEAQNLQTNEADENQEMDTDGKRIPVYDYVPIK